MAEAFFRTETFEFSKDDRATLAQAFGECSEIERRIALLESAAVIYREMSTGGPLEPVQPQEIAAELQGLVDACDQVADKIDALSADAQHEANIKPHRTVPKLREVIAEISRAASSAKLRARRGPKVQYPERELAGSIIDVWPEDVATAGYSRGSRLHTFALLVFQLVGARPRPQADRPQADGNLESILKPVIERRRTTSANSPLLRQK